MTWKHTNTCKSWRSDSSQRNSASSGTTAPAGFQRLVSRRLGDRSLFQSTLLRKTRILFVRTMTVVLTVTACFAAAERLDPGPLRNDRRPGLDRRLGAARVGAGALRMASRRVRSLVPGVRPSRLVAQRLHTRTFRRARATGVVPGWMAHASLRVLTRSTRPRLRAGSSKDGDRPGPKPSPRSNAARASSFL